MCSFRKLINRESLPDSQARILAGQIESSKGSSCGCNQLPRRHKRDQEKRTELEVALVWGIWRGFYGS